MSTIQEIATRFPFLAPVTKLPKAAQMGIAAGLVALIVVGSLWLREPPYRVLFSNLADKDGGAIVSALGKMNVPYRMSENGSAILIPASEVHKTRMMLAEQGLPQGGNVGFELMKDTQFGASQFAEQVTYQRAIEGELARSIEAMQSIASARVHLAMPKETLFVREHKKPTASVLLNLHPGRSLADGQVAAIAWLVASSVPDLDAQSISIVDQSGRLLSSKAGSESLGASATQTKFTADLEERTAARVLSILTPILGVGNVHTQVSAEVDFDQREQTSETYRPNQKPELAAVRSEQINESAQHGVSPAMGVPGALSNEPPAQPVAPITREPAQDSEPPTPTGPSSNQRNSTINYEVDRTISHIKEAVGRVKRLSVAVVINHRPNAQGVMEPLAPDELDQIRTLIEQAVGYSQERGDTLSVANTAFTSGEPSLPIWKDPYYIELAINLAKYLIIALVAALMWFKIIMPFVRKATISAAPSSPAADPGMDQQIDPQQLALESQKTGERYENAISAVRNIAQEDPRAAAFVLREWMKQEQKS